MTNINKYEPRKRTAIDGKVWWVAFDTETQKYSTMLYHGKHKTKKECVDNIKRMNKKYGG